MAEKKRKREAQVREMLVDLSKYLCHCCSSVCIIRHVINMPLIEGYLDTLMGLNIGPSGQVTKLQTIIAAQGYFISTIPEERSEEDEKILTTAIMARERTRELKRGLMGEKNNVAARKREYVAMNSHLSIPKEVEDFLGGDQLGRYIGQLPPTHVDVGR